MGYHRGQGSTGMLILCLSGAAQARPVNAMMQLSYCDTHGLFEPVVLAAYFRCELPRSSDVRPPIKRTGQNDWSQTESESHRTRE